MLDIKENLLDEDTGLPANKTQEFGVQPKNREVDLYIEIELPVAEDLFEAEPPPAIRGYNISYAERTTIAENAKQFGFSKGCVVTLRTNNEYQRISPMSWGIIIDNPVWEYDFNNHLYAPCKVQWVNGGTASHHWVDELIITHPAPDSADLEMIKSGE